MPRMYPPTVTPSTIRTIFWLLTASLLLSGCAGFTLVPADELEAERRQRQTLQAHEQQLMEQIINLTSVQGELETKLAAQGARREALEQQLAAADVQRDELVQRQAKLELYLQEQQSAAEGVKRLELKWERWREQELKQQSGAKQTSADDDAKLYLLVLEKSAQLARLNEQLEEAIREVVRTKAKLRSLESKAEAASDLAEAEIAVEALKAEGESWESDPGVIKAEELTELSAREFEQENYGGALYLTGQAKNVIKSAQARSMDQEMRSMAEGEVAFVLPLSLRLLSESNIMGGAGSQSNVLFSLQKGASVIGYSYKGQWVRVKTEDGAGGWVFYKKLAGPD